MNMLVDGEWRVDVGDSTDESGRFQRQTTTFRNWIAGSDVPTHVDSVPDDARGDERFQPEAGRYHLYVSYACPWAHRTLAVRALRGLADAIDVSVVDPWRGADGWQFSPDRDGCTPDRLHGSDFLRELYVRADPDATCRVTVPVLWDTERGTIVNNESREIIRMLDTAFEEFADGPRLLPGDETGIGDDERGIEHVDRTISDIYEPINNGVYRAGFASTQEAYDEAVDDLFDALDHWNEVLASQRYLAGETITEADVCLFTTLVRFDQVYHTHFKCNVQQIREYEHLWPYLRDLVQTDGIAETVRMDHIKEHYYTTHGDVNPSGIIARGPDLDFEAPHDRDRFGRT